MDYEVIIIGAGPAGLMAGIAAGRAVIFDQMNQAGRKLLISGKGRCNITNQCDINEMIKNIPGNGIFLHSCFRAFDNQKLIGFFEENNLPVKTERGGRVFPVSDKAADVRDALVRIFKERGGALRLNHRVVEIITEDMRILGVKLSDGRVVDGKKVILAAGGASYPATGSDGSGFELARSCGHTIVTLRPSLVPLEAASSYMPQLQGLSLRNVTAAVVVGGKKLKQEFGELLFTHFGLSGPIILSLSNFVKEHLAKSPVVISIDLKPALSEEKLDARLQRDFVKYSRKQMKNALGELLPLSLIPVVLQEAGITPDKYVNQLTKGERQAFLRILKNLPFTIKGTRPLAEAIVTAGGVSVKEIDPKTMRSKLVDNLYFAGEVIDIDGYTGGFNLQAAFSTGHAAGRAVREE